MSNRNKILYFLLFLSSSYYACSQNINLEIEFLSNSADVSNYKKIKKNAIEFTDLEKIIDVSIDSLKKQGYFKARVKEITKKDSFNYNSIIELNEQFNNIYIYDVNKVIIYEDKIRKIDNKEYYTVEINELESFLKKTTKKLADRGYPFNKIKLINIKEIDNSSISANLNVDLGEKRTLDKIKIKGYEKFPKSFTKQYLKLLTEETFDFEKIKEKSKKINNLGFVRQTKDPEVLFKKDSTITYLFIEKTENNSFDGFIGFATNEESNKLELNGYVNLKLSNTLNYGEEITLDYKSTDNEDKFFKTNIIAPFVLQSPLGLELSLNLTKKDTSYTKDEQSIGVNYLTKNKHGISLHLSYLNSVSNLTIVNQSIKDYNSKFQKIRYSYLIPNINNKLIPIKFLNTLEFSIGERRDNTNTRKQIKYKTKTYNNFKITNKSSIYLNFESYGLISTNFYQNEMLLFGGINSIRGFEENSIAANKLFMINSEYRFTIDNNIYINTILDSAYYENSLSDIKGYIYGLGLGLNINTNSGVFKINYANGVKKGEAVDLKLSKIHVSFSNTF
ncbi:MAG: Outer membrane protein assembly factor BamA [Flavobacteriaceae bacterium]|nr:MAG: Outer membrane protein assembly factor BamA [Flavobacteriaceae bacterium]